MAGSHVSEPSATPATAPLPDPILDARLETLEALADGISEPVAVLGPDLHVIYANHAARLRATPDQSALHLSKCYATFVDRSEPCANCPVRQVFESNGTHALSCASINDAACAMYQAVPLLSEAGKVSLVWVRFAESPPQHPKRLAQPSEAKLPSRLGNLIGGSPAMRDLFEMISLVSESQAAVLIQGESGTGKELVAKTIHSLSCRHDKPFVVVDCGSLPETLLESELFGHVKGAFTGASSNKKGLFEEAHGGTVFLDEIADTSGHFQAKLLRVLQEGEIKPVGSSQRIKVNARVISATNKDLTELIKTKTFREDLYYRLAVLPLSLPPLRERREDIPLLARHFAAVSCKRHHQPERTISPKTMQVLMEAPWPGNVRELQHFIERMVVTTNGPEVTYQDFRRLAPIPRRDLHTVSRSAAQQAERMRILEALQETQGNRVKAARILKISRAGLYNKLKTYQIG